MDASNSLCFYPLTAFSTYRKILACFFLTQTFFELSFYFFLKFDDGNFFYHYAINSYFRNEIIIFVGIEKRFFLSSTAVTWIIILSKKMHYFYNYNVIALHIRKCIFLLILFYSQIIPITN
jgi:hypothetical protein